MFPPWQYVNVNLAAMVRKKNVAFKSGHHLLGIEWEHKQK
jgi:hypothetical protein